ncbi:hypothetical protein [Ancylobacter oerskovii]|uniref:Uncharacterized protein n=1 Tax=Ancylobacter oerskovii TaxID=459519 RepID=A0ABW4Z5I2_9HYPH|nr:hypothetical protein [Ancylobacter oerskovii]MBS7543031.1 hypothetical protein [Ancylobacter oerskovii]
MALRQKINEKTPLTEEEQAIKKLGNEVNFAELRARLSEAKLRDFKARKELNTLRPKQKKV